MKNNFDVQSIGIKSKANKVYEFIAKPENLSLWTKAFVKADKTSAIMVTPNGELPIELETIIAKENGTIDWVMTMPDGSVGKAFSRVSENGENAIYSFVLLAPPVPLEQLEGALSEQKLILADELKRLKQILEHNY
ncbi:MAG: hypothetical protein COB12_04335 [Flavobacterium sp.]|nr:MAG: hypothetical protein COB12_04335 [Flavobacterium sp.]